MKSTSRKKSPSKEINIPSTLFLDLRETGDSLVTIRFRPEHLDSLTEHLRFYFGDVSASSPRVRAATQYQKAKDGGIYLEGDWSFLEIEVPGKLDEVTAKLGPWLMGMSRAFLARNQEQP